MDAITPPSTKERPIIFSAAMVRAILEGRKTQTRRAVKLPAWCGRYAGGPFSLDGAHVDEGMYGPNQQYLKVPAFDGTTHRVACPYGQPGDRLWVRETWVQWRGFAQDPEPFANVMYRADPADEDGRRKHSVNSDGRECWGFQRDGWKSSIHMPRWASRILLEIVSVRVERLQDISDADCQAEGVECCITEGAFKCVAGAGYSMPWMANYRKLWQSINGEGSWDANPWVWVVEFKPVEPA